ncbi:serine hydrolase domain-containing protein [Kutzneria sp. CA-103260]|uniref:serine hydrolase domain-containing protein n=1 Tax=Kutzneria sp. CA-103260 TaxID=2802641 RepID=UPI001BAB6B74|nr:serine hydrolase domain-containing protein [Kutzneria sp. CA-103260]QUQ72463.1 Beta-lactamase [Kutzneria sp. CA-103260]
MIESFLDELDARGMRVHSLLVHRHGELLLDFWQWPHEPGLRHKLHSATKSFTAAAVGFAEAEGLLGLEDPVSEFFPGAGDNFALMRVRDLLTMRTGHARGLSGATTRLRKTGWVGEFLEEPVVDRPGRNFRYSSTTSHVLSAIVQKVSGLPVDEYLRPRLFAPLGIADYEWERDPAGVSSGGNGLSLRPHDLLTFGLLHLYDGVWAGTRILPAGWVRKASGLHVPRAVSGEWNGQELVPPGPGAVANSGYGYQFWVHETGVYHASGLFGQECMIFPNHDAVVVITGAMADPTYHDLPAMLRNAFLCAFSQDIEPLDDRVLAARKPEVLSSEVDVPGFVRAFAFADNKQGVRSLTVEADADLLRLTVEDDRGTHVVEHGVGEWRRQDTGVSVWRLHHSYQEEDAPILAGARWLSADELELTWHFLEGPFIDHLLLRFEDDGVVLDHRVNCNSGPTELPTIRSVGP